MENRGVRSGHCYPLAAVPFCHLSFTCRKPKIISHLWKSEHYLARPALLIAAKSTLTPLRCLFVALRNPQRQSAFSKPAPAARGSTGDKFLRCRQADLKGILVETARELELGFFAFGHEAHQVLDEVVEFALADLVPPRRHVQRRWRTLRVHNRNLVLAVEDSLL